MSIRRTLILQLFLFITGSVLSQTDVPLVFVSRNHVTNGNILFPSSGLLPGMGSFSRFAKPGGKLMFRDSNGIITILVDSTKLFNGIRIVDVQQPCVNWDGERILFSGIESRDSNWRIYEIKKDGSNFRKITHTDRNINLSQFGSAAIKFITYDDIDPIYMPDGKIVFASTRFPTIAQEGGVLATNLFIMDSTGSNLFRITTERNGAEKPTIDPETGRIVYSRWWLNIDMPSNLTPNGLTRDTATGLTNDIGNLWQVNIINPDGDMLKLYAGDALKRKSLFGYRPRIDDSCNMYVNFIPHMPMLITGGSPGIRSYKKGLNGYKYIAGTDTSIQLYILNPPSTGTYQPPYAVDVIPFGNEKIIFSRASTVEAQDYGIYISDKDGSSAIQLIDLPFTLELNAEVLLPKRKPPIVEYLIDYDLNQLPPTSDPSTFYQGGLFRFDCMNIYSNAPVDGPIGNAPKISKNLKIKFFVNHQRQNIFGQDEPILLRTENVDYDGKIAIGDMPANIPMFEQITDSLNKVVSSGTNFAHVTGFNFASKGSGTKCVGCHAGHTQITVPMTITESQFTNLATSASITASSVLTGYNSESVIDRKARNKDLKVNWISNGGINEFIVMEFELPIEARELKIYNIYSNPENNTNIQVKDCEIFLYNNNIEVKHIFSTGELYADGKSIPISPVLNINKIKIIIKDFTGKINNISKSGLAEVEVVGRVYDYLSGTNDNNFVIKDFTLSQNYPNPFNPVTKIVYSLPKNSFVIIKLFDVTGKEIRTLVNEKMSEGSHIIAFNGSSLASGVYFYQMRAGEFTAVKRMVLIK